MDVQHRVQVEHEQKGNGRDGGVHTSKLGGSLPESKRTATGEQQMWAPRSGQEADDGGHSSLGGSASPQEPRASLPDPLISSS